MADADMGLTEVSATSVDVIAAMVQMELIESSVLYNTISDFSSLVAVGAKSVGIPLATSFTAQDKVENTATDTQAITFSTDSIALTIHKHIPVKLEDIAREQSVVNLDAEVVSRQVSAMVVAVESSIAGVLVKAANDIQLTGTSNLVLTLADIVDARKLLNVAHVPFNDRFLAIPPAQEAAILKIDGVVKANEYGSRDPIVNGEVGRLFGFRIVVSNSLASASEFVAYHKSHVGFAKQQGLKFEKQRASLANLADEFSLSMIYGVKQLDSGNRAVYADESAVA